MERDREMRGKKEMEREMRGNGKGIGRRIRTNGGYLKVYCHYSTSCCHLSSLRQQQLYFSIVYREKNLYLSIYRYSKIQREGEEQKFYFHFHLDRCTFFFYFFYDCYYLTIERAYY